MATGPIGPSSPGYAQGTANTQRLIPASGPGPQYANNTLASHPAGQVLGASTGPSYGGSAAAPQQQFSIAGALAPQPSQPSVDFDALIAPAIQGLQAAIQPLQEGYNTQVGDINARQQEQTAQTNTNIGAQDQLLANSGQQQQTQAQNANDQARQMYSEINQGLQAKYGGTTGTGAFASELAGRQTLQNVNQIHQGLQTAMTDIATRRQQVQQVGQEAIQHINDQTNQQLQSAKVNLDNQLADIRNQTGQLQSHKAELALQAMQVYQQSVNQVNSQNAAFRQNLILQQQQADAQLAAAQTYAHQTATGFNPQTNYGAIAGGQLTPVGNNAQQQAQAGAQYIDPRYLQGQ